MSSSNGHRRTFNSPAEARAQAAEAQGFLASIIIKAGGEDYEVPQRGLLDDDQADRMFALELETESWDREDPITIKAPDGSETTRQGPLKRPYRKDGKLIKPAYAVQVATAIWGQAKYDKYKAAGGRASDVTAALAYLDQRVQEREADDSKSVGGDRPAASLAQTD